MRSKKKTDFEVLVGRIQATSDALQQDVLEVTAYLRERFGKGYTACNLLTDTLTLASMRKVRRCLAFLYGVDADAIEAATWYDPLTAA